MTPRLLGRCRLAQSLEPGGEPRLHRADRESRSASAISRARQALEVGELEDPALVGRRARRARHGPARDRGWRARARRPASSSPASPALRETRADFWRSRARERIRIANQVRTRPRFGSKSFALRQASRSTSCRRSSASRRSRTIRRARPEEDARSGARRARRQRHRGPPAPSRRRAPRHLGVVARVGSATHADRITPLLSHACAGLAAW